LEGGEGICVIDQIAKSYLSDDEEDLEKD